MSQSFEKVTTILVVSVILLHLSYAPFTKVEESFNIQATHDILASGISWNQTGEFLRANYDHVEFPGSVPRTFVGAVVLSLLTGIPQLLGAATAGLDAQVLVRGVLGIVNAFSLISFRNAVSQTFGSTAATWYMILQTSQFHLMYYASRTLPNIFAFVLTTLALRNFVYGLSARSDQAKAWYRECLFLLTFAGVVFRSEIAILVFSISAFLAGVNSSTIPSVVVPAGLVGAVAGLMATLVVDSYFWNKFPMWPELQGFYYNTILGKSSDWGVSPPNYYYTNAIPKLMMNPMTYTLLIPIAVFSPATRSKSLALLLPSITFVFVYSFLPHKEWRFIIYIIPALTAVASVGASWIWTRRSKGIIYRLLSVVLVLSTAASFAASASLLAISRLNYPGGEAVMRLHALTADSTTTVRVHADNLACQTGLTRFLEDRSNLTESGSPRWIFDKTEDEQKLLDPAFWDQFDYVIVEKPERVIGKFTIVDLVRGYGGIQVKRPGEMLDNRSFEDRFVGGKILKPEPWEQKWIDLGGWAREKFTKGWWPMVKMETKLRIMKKQNSPVNTVVG
ncbi:uncharacterized protein PV09_04814 [Verruconis gallopava]|uniref:Mannosyltransferase n=1 Tax=Verruconis gallopava TaxID=253628 RepID=A0A0D2AB36_9PEZI|nr:uncharacterized protein PV09_04814 [Verruconis gallopava]KIW03983.1 hypothetical protein PV09_04814 [Verruconis gallopava]